MITLLDVENIIILGCVVYQGIAAYRMRRDYKKAVEESLALRTGTGMSPKQKFIMTDVKDSPLKPV